MSKIEIRDSLPAPPPGERWSWEWLKDDDGDEYALEITLSFQPRWPGDVDRVVMTRTREEIEKSNFDIIEKTGQTMLRQHRSLNRSFTR